MFIWVSKAVLQAGGNTNQQRAGTHDYSARPARRRQMRVVNMKDDR